MTSAKATIRDTLSPISNGMIELKWYRWFPLLRLTYNRKGRAMVKWPGPNSRSVFEGHSWEVAARSQSAARPLVSSSFFRVVPLDRQHVVA